MSIHLFRIKLMKSTKNSLYRFIWPDFKIFPSSGSIVIIFRGCKMVFWEIQHPLAGAVSRRDFSPSGFQDYAPNPISSVDQPDLKINLNEITSWWIFINYERDLQLCIYSVFVGAINDLEELWARNSILMKTANPLQIQAPAVSQIKMRDNNGRELRNSQFIRLQAVFFLLR